MKDWYWLALGGAACVAAGAALALRLGRGIVGRHLAQYDLLTGLPNRGLLRDRLTQAMARAERNKHVTALIFTDIDHFKHINDSAGHGIGDQVLKATAQRLRECLRDSDTVARFGGDEFMIVLEDLADSAHATQVAEKIKAALAHPLFIEQREFIVSVSMGIAIYPSDTTDAENLMQAADIAMYRAKEAGRNGHAMFAPEMALQITERNAMQAQLHRALDRGELAVHYQPKVALDKNRIIGVEALLRWNNAELGEVAPSRFIALAEETGIIVAIGNWVLRTACMQGKAWLDQGLPPLRIAVNLTPRQLRETGFVECVAAVLRETGLPANQLEFELNEAMVMDSGNGNIEKLDALRAMGISLAIDDFGTGYSSLGALARLPIQTLKIDKSFVMNMLEDTKAMVLVSTIVTLAHSLKLKVIAEGVESEEQRRILYLLRCDQMQGKHSGAPVPACDLERLMRANDTNTPIRSEVRTAREMI